MARIHQLSGTLFLEGRKPLKLREWALDMKVTDGVAQGTLTFDNVLGYPFPREGLNFRLYPKRDPQGLLPDDTHFWGILLPGGEVRHVRIHPQQQNPDVP